MNKGELVCFSLEHKPIRLKSMNATRHPQLKDRLGITPPEVAKAPPLETPDEAPARKPTPLSPWHFDPQLFRKWPRFVAAEMGEMETLTEREVGNEVSLGL